MLDGLFIECLHSLVVWRCKGEVKARADANSIRTKLKCQFVSATGQAISDSLVRLPGSQITPHTNIPKRRKHRVVKFGCVVDVRNAKRNVMKHVHGKSLDA